MLTDKQIRYIDAADAGVELIKCENSCLSYPLHNHISVVTFGMILSGNIQVTLSGEKYCFDENQIFVIPPYIPHSIEATGKYTMISLCIHKEVMKQIHLNRLLSITAYLINKSFILNHITPEQSALIRDAIASYKNNLPICNDSISNINGLKHIIEQYPEQNITIEEMAQQVSLSKYYFIRTFKQEVGLTPHQFLIQNRVRKAQRILKQPLSMTEVALVTGFFDQSHFIKNFERIVGLTPSCYKSVYQSVHVHSH